MGATTSPVDTINGFTGVYLDARGIKGAWEALVFYVNNEKTSEIRKPRRPVVRGSDAAGSEAEARCAGHTANAIDVVIETGDSGPVTPVGINLRTISQCAGNGSKSVSLSNINEA